MGRTKTTLEARETLDLSFKDEEIFGLWVAALRALMYETEPVSHRHRFMMSVVDSCAKTGTSFPSAPRSHTLHPRSFFAQYPP